MFSTALSLLGFFAIPLAWNACPSSLKPTYYLYFISASSLKISPPPIMISYSVFSLRFYSILFLLLQLFCSMHSVLFLSLPDSLDCQLRKYRPTTPPLVQSIFGILTSIYMDPLQAHSIKEHGVEISWSLLLLMVIWKVYVLLRNFQFFKWNESSEGQAVSMWYFVSQSKAGSIKRAAAQSELGINKIK